MPFEKISTINLAAASADQIRRLIAVDVLKPGDPLPAERDLAARMGISRNSLREGLQTLVAEGLIVGRQGSGFRVASEIGRTITDPLLTLLNHAPQTLADYLAFRRMFEGSAAAWVAKHATASERTAINDIVRQMQSAYDCGNTKAEAALDIQFHMALVQTTGNVVAIQVMRALHRLLEDAIAHSHDLILDNPDVRRSVLAQHQSINAAIQAFACDPARLALEEHLSFVEMTLHQMTDAEIRRKTVEDRQAWMREKG